MSKNNNRCFVIMPFSTPSGYEPDHFTKIYEQIIKPSIKQAGLEAERVDENLLSTDIVAKIFKGLTECDMAICDLSSRNPNVLYELGIRQAYNKPVLLIKDEKTDQIFDVGGLTTIPYNSHRLYENVTEAINTISDALKEHMRNKEGVIDIIKGRLGTNFEESKLPSHTEMNPDQQILSLLLSLTEDVDSIKRRMNDNEYRINIYDDSGKIINFEDFNKRKEIYKNLNNFSIEDSKKISSKDILKMLNEFSENDINEFNKRINTKKVIK